MGQRDLDVGIPWPEQLQDSLSRSRGLILVTPLEPMAGWVRAEVEWALNQAALDSEFRLVPILQRGQSVETLPPFVQRYQAIELPVPLAALTPENYAWLVERLSRARTWTVERTVDVESPFPGLEPFREERARYFFGRSAEISERIEVLEDHRWLHYEGGRGMGKSSLVRAVFGFTRGSAQRWFNFAHSRQVLSGKTRPDPPERLTKLLAFTVTAAPFRDRYVPAIGHGSSGGRRPTTCKDTSTSWRSACFDIPLRAMTLMPTTVMLR